MGGKLVNNFIIAFNFYLFVFLQNCYKCRLLSISKRPIVGRNPIAFSKEAFHGDGGKES